MIRLLLKDSHAQFYVTRCIQAEIVSRNKYKGIKVPSPVLGEIQLLRCNHDLNAFDTNCIKKLLNNYNSQKFVVVTANPEFAEAINNNLQCLVILYSNDRLYMKPVSVFVKSVHYQMVQDDFSRLKLRLLLLNLVETKAGVGGDSFFASLSKQLNLGCPKQSRAVIVDKIKGQPSTYAPLIEVDDYDFDYFIDYIAKDGAWANSAVMQAVADTFSVRVVIVSGCEDQFLLEWWPIGKPDTANLPVVIFGYLEGFRYTSLSFTEDPYLLYQQEEALDVDYQFQKSGQKLLSEVYQKLRGRISIDHDDEALGESLMARVKRRLITYCFKEVPVRGDGNCCLRSISLNAHRDEDLHKEVRKEIIQQLRDHPERYRNQVYKDYVDRMSIPKTWGDDTFLQAYTDIKKCRIFSIAATPTEIAYDYYPPGFELVSCEIDYFLSDSGSHNNAMFADSELLRIARSKAEASSKAARWLRAFERMANAKT